MYDQHFQQSVIQSGMDANPARGQLKRGESFFIPSFCSRGLAMSGVRDRFGRPFPRQPAHHRSAHSEAESGAYSRDSSRFPRRRSYIPSTAIGQVPRLSCEGIVYQSLSLPKSLHQHRSSSPFRYHHGPMFMRLLTVPGMMLLALCYYCTIGEPD